VTSHEAPGTKRSRRLLSYRQRDVLQPILFRVARQVATAVLALLVALPALALPAEAVRKLAFGDNDARLEAMSALAASGERGALPLLEALQDGELQTAGLRVLRVKGDVAIDAVTGERLPALPDARDDVMVNNRVRRELAGAIATLRLADPDRQVRLAAVKALQSGADESVLPALQRALSRERDPDIRALLVHAVAVLELGSSDKATRLAAVTALARSADPSTRTLLLPLLEAKGGTYAEPDVDVRTAAELALRTVDRRLALGDTLGRIFTGLSLGSVLLLAALGLAITYGLMGVINMAHGELIMIGAYATYLVQNATRTHFPHAFDAYLVVAMPVAFAASAVVGMVLERTVIRFLYGRPLETLLATWGLSLVLIQGTRALFGAQNVQVENPSWMSGGLEVLPSLVLPWNRIAIIVFAVAVVALLALLIARTRLGLFVRAVTQNRPMAGALGVATGRVDMLAFGLGSGIAGLAGCALSQIGNVGPDLGQAYIVDSFMVVVLGGVGQLAGTVYAALGLGIVNKLLEGVAGAVPAKIAVLVFIVVFIQKRPQGLFALKGRMADA
jgi:urea transport system permease protein